MLIIFCKKNFFVAFKKHVCYSPAANGEILIESTPQQAALHQYNQPYMNSFSYPTYNYSPQPHHQYQIQNVNYHYPYSPDHQKHYVFFKNQTKYIYNLIPF